MTTGAPRAPAGRPGGPIAAVVKVGGGLLRHPAHLAAAADALGEAAGAHALVVVPGGGTFADAVRAVDRDLGVPDDAAHWMAVLAMDQYAHLLAARLPRAAVVAGAHEIAATLDAGAIPVLAPFRWLRAADPLPHSWDVTSDSIAAWVAGALRARRLVLVKPPGADGGDDAVDPYFARALPAGLPVTILPAERVATLASLLGGDQRGPPAG